LRIQQRVQPEGTYLDFDKWRKVKQEILGGAFDNSPGCLLAYTRIDIDEQDFLQGNNMQVQYSFTDKFKMFLVLKDKWSRAELNDIAIYSLDFRSFNLL